MTYDSKHLGRSTLTIHAGSEIDPTTGAVAPPIYQTSTFAFASCEQGAARFAGQEDGFIYTRMGNPTTARLEAAVAALEGGAGALATSSGMSALCTVLVALLGQGDHVVGSSSVYGPSRVVIERDFSRFGVTSTFVETADLAAVKAAVRPETRLVLVETPANPTMAITDLAAVAAIAHANGATLLVDNTFASPALQRPIEWGADVVMHSMTKFINGHSDIVAGMVVSATEAMHRRIRPVHAYLGACMDPHQAWLTLRGLRTLAMRVRTSQAGALTVAPWLEQHPKVEWVRYPGLPSHPQYELGHRQMDGPGSLISFELRGGLEAGVRMLNHVKLMTLAVSLGGVESLIQHPASMTHAAMPRPDRLAAGISDGLVRLSVGCEDVEDVIADLSQALDQA
ncbi:MAG: aminotransferase class I/II-fold pyridoxal phosphate-dependent enzyme [Thermoanaerobaculaceae bacterium]|nr:aminotransferase class I/II-fold pyridoxal phosphate-dependent enzyme [Thermoanaerobaculaceae bacterium]